MIAASQEILSDLGVDGLTVDEVARRSGVAKSTLYRHFESVDDLVLAAVDELVHPSDIPDTGSFEGDLQQVVSEFLEVARTPAFRNFFVSMIARGRRDPEFAARVAAMKEQRQSPLRIVVQRGIARGEVDPDIDLDHAVHFVHSPFVTMLVEDAEMSEHEIAIQLALARRGLAPRS